MLLLLLTSNQVCCCCCCCLSECDTFALNRRHFLQQQQPMSVEGASEARGLDACALAVAAQSSSALPLKALVCCWLSRITQAAANAGASNAFACECVFNAAAAVLALATFSQSEANAGSTKLILHLAFKANAREQVTHTQHKHQSHLFNANKTYIHSAFFLNYKSYSIKTTTTTRSKTS